MKTAEEQPGIVILIQDTPTRETAQSNLRCLGPVFTAASPAEAEQFLNSENCGVLLVEDELDEEAGLMFFARINHLYPWLRRILISGPLDPDLLLLMINEANVFRCISKPVDGNTLRAMVSAALVAHLEARRLLETAAHSERLRKEQADRSRRARQWLAQIPRIFYIVLLTFGWILLIGTLTLGTLYLLKSFLGIDLVEGMHLRDLFR